MAIDLIGYAVAKATADKQQISEAAANRIAIVGSMLGSPVMALVAARTMAEREAAAQASAATVGATVVQPSIPASDKFIDEQGTTPDSGVARMRKAIREVRGTAEAAKKAADQAKDVAAEAKKIAEHALASSGKAGPTAR